MARINGWKGYVPALPQEGASLIVTDADRHAHYLRRGYVKIGPCKGDRRENDTGAPRAYYQSTVGGRARFRQGVAQAVHETWQGVDAHNGISTHRHAGLVLGRRAEQIAQSARTRSGRNDGLPVGESLLPIFNAQGRSHWQRHRTDAVNWPPFRPDT